MGRFRVGSTSSASLLDVNSTDQFNPAEQYETEFYKALDRAKTNFDPTRRGFEEFEAECDVDETLINAIQNLGQS